MSIPRIIYVMGIDGSGKTTVVEWLAEKLHDQGYPVDILWLRFNHFLTKPLLAFCRLTGLTRYETVSGIRVGYHDFYRSKVVSWLFIFLQYLDALRVRWIDIAPNLHGKKKVLILDRYICDILIDLMVDTGIQDLYQGLIGKAFLQLLPEGTLVLPLARDVQHLLEVRPESGVDKNFYTRLNLYELLFSRQGLEPLRNNGSLEETLSAVANRVGLKQ